jgi:hypothetical protein
LNITFAHFDGLCLQTLFSSLHPSLRKQIYFLVCRHFLPQIQFLEGLPTSVQQYLSLFVHMRIYLPGDIIVQEGDVVSAVHFLSNGEAKLVNKKHWIKNVYTYSLAFEESLVNPGIATESLMATSLTEVFTLGEFHAIGTFRVRH